MNTLFKTRCNKGQLVIYDDSVAIELNMMGTSNKNALYNKQITGIEIS